MYIPLRLIRREILFVVDVAINWATNRNWQTKVLDTRKVTQLTLLRQESVIDQAMFQGGARAAFWFFTYRLMVSTDRIK